MLDHDVDLVAILHFKAVRRIIVLDSLSIKNEAALVVGETLSLAVGVHQFLQLSGPLDFEVDFGTILSLHLDVDVLVFASGGSFGGSSSWGGVSGLLVGHFVEFEVSLHKLIYKFKQMKSI